MSQVPVVVTGCLGRMGTTLVRLVGADAALSLVGATDRGPPPAGLPTKYFSSLEEALSSAKPRVVIDFTAPAATLTHAQLCAKSGVAIVVGTTGIDAAGRKVLENASQSIPMVVAPNMSIGVNVFFHIAAQLAKALGDDYDREILELHHKRKKDAPSGTALKLAEVIAKASGRTEKDYRYERHGEIGERPAGEIGFATVRGGDVVGEHTAYFFGEGERIELTHRATHRDQFGSGAVKAARWVVAQKPGLYGMADVLGLQGA